MTPLDDLRARCAAQDAAHETRLRHILTPCKRRKSAPPARPAWYANGKPSEAIEGRSLLDGLHGRIKYTGRRG